MPSESNLGEANRVQRTENREQSKFACYEYLSTPSATLSVARPSSKRDNYIVLLFNPLNICKILPRRRGSGSDKVDDEGVENESTEHRAKSK